MPVLRWPSLPAWILAGAAFGAWTGLLEMAAFHAASGVAHGASIAAAAVYAAGAFALVSCAVAAVRPLAARARLPADPARLLAAGLLAAFFVGRCVVDGDAIRFVTNAGAGAWFAAASTLGAAAIGAACLLAPAAPAASIARAALLAAGALTYVPFGMRLALGDRVGGPWYALLAGVTAIAAGGAFALALRATPRPLTLALAALLLGPVGWRAAAGPPADEAVIQDVPQATASTAPDARPDVILIVLDTLRADHMELHGYARETMPRLTAFARRSRLYLHCLANSPWSLPSHATLFTGLYPREHGAMNWAPPGARPRPQALPGDVPTLAELLAARGWRTAGISANYAYVTPRFGLSRGFQYWDSRPGVRGAMARGFWPSLFRSTTVVDKFPFRWIYDPLVWLDVAQVPYRRAAEINRLVLAWLDAQAGDAAPFFLFVNYMDAHDPFRAPSGFVDAFPGRRHDMPHELSSRARFGELSREAFYAHFYSEYDSEIAYLDFQLGELLEQLGARGVLQDAIVVILGDHGEQFLEHDAWGHGRSVYQVEMHVPLIVHEPGVAPAVIRHPVEQRDVAPWLLERLGVPLPPQVAPADLREGLRVKVGEVLHETEGRKLVLRRDALALVRTAGHPDELYDLAADPAQRLDLAARRPGETRRLGEELTRWTETHAVRAGAAPEIDAGTVEELRELGYVP